MRGATSWSYQHDALDALISETLAIDGLSFATGYTRNANGFVTHWVTPGGRNVSYLPDGFGRPTRVQVGSVSYASGAGYHPSGGLASLSYGNGHALSQTYNALNRVSRVRDTATGTVWRSYAYDARGNTTSNGQLRVRRPSPPGAPDDRGRDDLFGLHVRRGAGLPAERDDGGDG